MSTCQMFPLHIQLPAHAGLRRSRWVFAGLTIALTLLFAGLPATAQSACTTSQVLVLTDPTGDQTGATAGANTQLDIQSVSVSEDYTYIGLSRLVVVLKVQNLNTIPASSIWRVTWNFGGTSYYIGMNSDTSSAVTFDYGTISGSLSTSAGAADSGSFRMDGTITMTIGLNKVGGPIAAAQLTGVSAETDTFIGAAGTGLLQSDDDASNASSSSNFTYTMAGQSASCVPVQPPGFVSATYTKGGIGFSPNFTTRAPAIGQDVEPSIRTDVLGNTYVSSIRGVPAGSDLWYFDLRPTIPDLVTGAPTPNALYDPFMRNPQYRGQPDAIRGGQEITFGGDGGGDSAIAVGFGSPGGGQPPTLAYASLVAGNISTQRSTNLGETFIANPLGNLTGGLAGDDRQWLEFFGTTTVYMVYRTLDPALAQVQQSIDGGLTWGPSVPIGFIGQVGGISVDQNDGTVYVSGSSGAVAVGIPAAPGLLPDTYTIHQVASGSVAHIFFTVKAAPDGTVYVCYSNESSILIQYSKDHGNTWSSPIRVSDGPDTLVAVLPWMEAGPISGTIGVVWYGTNQSSNTDADDWKVFYALGTNVTSSTPTFQQVVASDHIIHAGNISESGLVVTGTSPNRNLADFFQVSFDPVGAAVIAYCDDHNDFAGQTYVTRQVSGPGVNGQTVPAPVEGAGLPAPNPNGAIQVRDASDDVRNGGNPELGGTIVVSTNDPLDITGIQYLTGSAPNGDMQLVARMIVSDLSTIPPGSSWRMNFTANAPNSVIAPSGDWDWGISDRGDQFYLRADTDNTGNPSFVYGTATRNFSGGIVYTDQGAADSGAINSGSNTIEVRISASKLNALLSGAGHPLICGGSVIAGLRGQAFTPLPEVGSPTRIDTARGGTQVMLDRPPMAALSALPGSGIAPMTVTLDASGSSDPDPCDGVTSYTFNFGDGSAPVTTSSPTVTHTYNGGNFTASVTVADHAGMGSNAATATIFADTRPVAVLTATPSSGTPPLTATFSGAGSSDANPSDSITSYTFTFGDGSPAVVQASPTVSHSYSGAHTSYAATLTVNDNHGSPSFPASIVITTLNRPPVAVNDSATTARNTAVTINVLGNDSDPDGDPLTVIGVHQPAHGGVVVNSSGANNNITYTPARNFFGLDTFTYTVSDGFGGSATATVTVTVTH